MILYINFSIALLFMFVCLFVCLSVTFFFESLSACMRLEFLRPSGFLWRITLMMEGAGLRPLVYYRHVISKQPLTPHHVGIHISLKIKPYYSIYNIYSGAQRIKHQSRLPEEKPLLYDTTSWTSTSRSNKRKIF
jgi:hypothetical protein